MKQKGTGVRKLSDHITPPPWKGVRWGKNSRIGWKDFLVGIQIALLRELIPVRGAETKSKSLLISFQAEYTFCEVWKYFHRGDEQQWCWQCWKDLSRGREVGELAETSSSGAFPYGCKRRWQNPRLFLLVAYLRVIVSQNFSILSHSTNANLSLHPIATFYRCIS